MVTQVSYPGVYIEEVPSSVRTITAVSTSITAFIGRAREGPVNKAIRILSLSEFERTFGSPLPESELSASVRLFFHNGGTDCYIVRVVGEVSGERSSTKLKNEDGDIVLEIAAKEIGSWGNELAVQVDYNTTEPENTFHLRVYRMADDNTVKDTEEYLNCSLDVASPHYIKTFISTQSNLIDCKPPDGFNIVLENAKATSPGYSESRKIYSKDIDMLTDLNALTASTGSIKKSKFRISIDEGTFYEVDLADLVPESIPPESTAAEISTEISNMKEAISNRINLAVPRTLVNQVNVEFVAGHNIDDTTTGKVIRFISNTSEKKSITIQSAATNDITKDLFLGIDQGGIEHSLYARFRPAPNGIFLKFNQINSLAGKDQSSFDKITIGGHEIDLGNRLQTKGPTNKWYEGKETQIEGVREKLKIIASAINDANVGWIAKVVGSRLTIEKKSLNVKDKSTISTKPSDIGSLLAINEMFYFLGNKEGNFVTEAKEGTEGGAPSVNSYNGNPETHTGFYALDLIDLFNLMVIPRDDNIKVDAYPSLWASASTYCKEHRAFLILEPPKEWNNYKKILEQKSAFRIGVEKKNAAIYFPDLKIRENGLLKSVGPSGAIAGLYSRIDSSGGGGVWKAPAGTSADIQAISDLDVILTDLENGVLNKEGVNCIRRFPNGIVSWGARTIDGADDFGSEWKYIPIRRLSLLIEESLFRGTKWVVFEPNDEPLWAKIRLNVRAFMMNLFRQGAFQGGSPDKAFFVKCDAETTTQADRNLGIVNILVGFAPLKPAEFVIIKIQQMAGEL